MACPILHSEVAYVTWNTAVNHTHILSTNLVNSFQFTYSETDLDRGPLPVGDNLNFQKMGVNVPLATEGTENTLVPLFRGGVTNHWNMNQDAWEPDDRPAVQFKNDTSYTRGEPRAEVRRRISDGRRTIGRRATATTPVSISTANTRDTRSATSSSGDQARWSSSPCDTTRDARKAFATYIQDDWQVRPRRHVLARRAVGAVHRVLRSRPAAAGLPARREVDDIPERAVGAAVCRRSGRSERRPSDQMGQTLRREWLRRGRLNEKTSLRTAYGIFHDTARFFHYPKTLVFTPPYSISRTTNDVQFSDPYRNAPNPYPYRPPASSAEYATYQYQLPVRVTSYPDDFSGGFSQQWNVNLQRDLGADLVVSAAYVGTKARGPANQPADKPGGVWTGCDAGESSAATPVSAIRKHHELRSDRQIRVPRHAVEREQAIQPRIFDSGQLHPEQGERQREQR